MKAIPVNIRRIGNSQGILIPKPVLAQLGLETEVSAEISVEGNALVLRKAARPVRQGWAEAAERIAAAGDDGLVLGEFANAADADWEW